MKFEINVYQQPLPVLDNMYAALQSLTRQGEFLMASIQDIKAKVEAQTTVVSSAVTLLQQLSNKIQELVNTGADPAAIQAVLDELNANTDALATAVTANTPAAPVETPPQP